MPRMPEDSDPTPPKPEPGPKSSRAGDERKRKRSWGRRIWRAFLILLLLLVVFHRPLFHTAFRLALIKVAAKQNVTLQVQFAGSIFTNLDIRDVTAYPTGAAPSPVEKITIESVHLEYSLPKLLRGGLGEFLKSYQIKNADLRLLALPSKDEREREQKLTLARDLNNLLAQPAFYADQVTVENFNIRVEAEKNVTEVQGVDIFLHPEQLGYLRVKRLQIPTLPEWKNLSAVTSYAGRNLFVRGLELEPGKLVIDEFNFDASQRAQERASVELNASAFGGTIHATLEGAQLPKKGENLLRSYDTDLKLEAAGVDLTAAADYFGGKPIPIGKIEKLRLGAVGEPERPRTWSGTVSASVANTGAGALAFSRLQAEAVFQNGNAKITTGEVVVGENVARVEGSAILPESVNDFASTEGSARVSIKAPNLLQVTSPFMRKLPIGGSATAEGTVSIGKRSVSVEVEAQGERIGNALYGAGKVSVKATGTKPFDVPKDAPLTGLIGKAEADLSDVRFESFSADTAAVSAEIAEELVTVHNLQVARGENRIAAQGNYRINIRDATAAPAEGDFQIRVPDLSAFGVEFKESKLGGKFVGDGSIKIVDGAMSGAIEIEGTGLSLGDFETEQLAASVKVANDEASIEQLRLKIKGQDQVAATGKIGLKKPLSYEGAALVLIKDLAVLQPLLTILGVEEPVTGTIDLSIEGKGQIAAPQQHEGELTLSLKDAKYGKIDLTEVTLSGIYGPEFAESTALKIVSGITSLQGSLDWREGKLRLRDINLMQGSQQAFTGFVIIPFDPRKPDEMIPLDGRIAANLNARELNLEKLMASLGQTTPIVGVVTANLIAGGTFLNPAAHLRLGVKQLRAKAAEKIAAAELNLVANYAEDELTLDTTLRQPQIQPLTIKGRVPLDLEGTIQQKKLDPNLPLDLAVRLPASSLAFLPTLVPDIRRVEGTAAIDARVSGTVAKPEFAGSANIRIEYARLKNESIPAIGRFTADIGFANDELRIRSVRGEIGGGTFQLTGGVKIPRWFEPEFNLRLVSDDVLVRRDDSVTVRVDTNITATGPLQAGAIKGTVWVTQSRFFREIDILPIGLPGRPKPKAAPKSAGPKGFSIEKPPFRDWTFDVAIKTRPNDPFQIRGNLANGAAAADLRLGGTGLNPYLEGMIRVDNFVATLPFSKLTVTRGFITFSPDAPFEPTLDLLAESELRDYRIIANIYGSASDPQLSLTSEPPLPQEDIISLLATGTTTSELTGSSDVLAGRAAVLLFQQLYRKIFKRDDPAEGVPFLDRFDVNLGAVDERTGRQEISATMKLGEHFYLVGDVDVTGEFAARIRYLIRFR